jgi:hypothetical protein
MHKYDVPFAQRFVLNVYYFVSKIQSQKLLLEIVAEFPILNLAPGHKLIILNMSDNSARAARHGRVFGMLV